MDRHIPDDCYREYTWTEFHVSFSLVARYQLGPEPPARYLTLRPVKHEYVLSSHRRAVKAISASVACSGAHCRNASSCHGGKEITPGRAPRGRLSISHLDYDDVTFLVKFQDSPVLGNSSILRQKEENTGGTRNSSAHQTWSQPTIVGHSSSSLHLAPSSACLSFSFYSI